MPKCASGSAAGIWWGIVTNRLKLKACVQRIHAEEYERDEASWAVYACLPGPLLSGALIHPPASLQSLNLRPHKLSLLGWLTMVDIDPTAPVYDVRAAVATR